VIESCGECRFSVLELVGGKKRHGRQAICLRYPVEQRKRVDQWCGEFQPKPVATTPTPPAPKAKPKKAKAPTPESPPPGEAHGPGAV
jgi:hypothetical protein